MLQSPRILVTTVIPAYQASRFVARALESAIAQDIPDHEIIVVDDGSTDGTREVVRRYAEHGVRLIGHSSHRGASAARNTGVDAARGEYVAFLDADDEWLPSKLRQQLAVIVGNPRMTLITCRADLFDEHGHNTGDLYRGETLSPGPDAWRALLSAPLIGTPTVLARRDALIASGGFNPRLFVGEDQDMWLRLALAGEVGIVPEVLVHVHSMPNSLSKASIQDQQDVVLPMVFTHLARNRHRLTPAEVRAIMASRYMRAGRLAYGRGEVFYALKCFSLAIRYGHPPLRVVFFLVRASAALRLAKRLVRGFVLPLMPARGSRGPRRAPQGVQEGAFQSVGAPSQHPQPHLARNEYQRTDGCIRHKA